MLNFVQIGPLVRPGRVLKESKINKKGEERNLQWQTGCSPRPPTLTQRYVVLHAGWSSGGSSKFRRNRFNGVPDMGGGRISPAPGRVEQEWPIAVTLAPLDGAKVACSLRYESSD